VSNLEEVLSEELKMLVRATRSERFRFIIIQFNHYGLIRKVESELKKAYPQRKITNIKVEKDTAEHFVNSIFEAQTGFVFVENFEKLFEEQYRSLALGLNQRRDKFANYPIILLAFIPWGNAYLQACQKAMPDMFSLVNPVIQLKQELQEIRYTNKFIDDFFEFNDISGAQEEINRIEVRLKNLESTPDTFQLKIHLIIQLGQAYQFLGKYESARKIFSDCLDLIKAYPSDYANEKTLLENSLALALGELGENIEAKKILENIIAKTNEDTDVNDSNKAIYLSNLATVLSNLGDYGKAKEILEKAVVMDENILGEDHPNTAIRYSNLATVLGYLQDYEGAKILSEKALISDEKNFGSNHPRVALRYSNLSVISYLIGDYQRAKELLEKALISDEKNFGKKHPNTLLSYESLALVLEQLGEYEKAINVLSFVYDVRLNDLGINHFKTKETKENLDSLKMKANFNPN
jgi:tetratricopeptide (TPR) repeat protein